MKLLVLKETKSNEARVAISVDLIAKYQKQGFEIFVEKGAGEKSSISDEVYSKAGAQVVDDVAQILPQADVIISVQRTDIDVSKVKKGAVFIGMLNPYFEKDKILQLAAAGISPFALELVPRITRAQSMDVLSSQSNLAGYVSVLSAVNSMQKCVPMMMTAAGTVSAAKFLILGAGVAGLQAIATAKRLGGIVSAFDVRAAAKEQVQSLGAKFIEVKTTAAQDLETKGGYAKEMTEEYKQQQQKLIFDTIINQDVVISTALIPGKKAPILITADMVKNMKAGSVIVDLAAANGGNCELTENGKIKQVGQVTIIGHENFASLVSSDASKLYAKNIFNFIELLVDKEKKNIAINLEDEILKATLIS